MENNLDEFYTVSTEHVKLRLVLFVCAVVALLVSVGIGVGQLLKKAPGYYEIVPEPDDTAPRYKNGITLMYHFEGTSADIKAEQNAVKALYSSALLLSYKLLDAETAYPGITNFASLNARLGEEVSVSPELYHVLFDLWEKTREANGVNLFSGALLSEWDSVLSLSDMSGFDPRENAEFAARMETLAAKTAGLSQFSATFDPAALRVKLEVSQDYLDFLRENEFSGKIVTAGRLSDAYRLDMIRDALEAHGFADGYLCTESGLTLSLAAHSGGAYSMYGFENRRVVQGETLPAAPNSAFSFLRAFPLQDGELMYHVVEDGAAARYYHPNFRLRDGGFSDALLSSGVADYSGDVVTVCYRNLALWQAESADEVRAAAEALPGTVSLVVPIMYR